MSLARTTLRLRAGSRDYLQHLIGLPREDGKAATTTKTVNEVFEKMRLEGDVSSMEVEIIRLWLEGWKGGEDYVSRHLRETQRVTLSFTDDVVEFLGGLRFSVRKLGLLVSINDVVNGLLSLSAENDSIYNIEAALTKIATSDEVLSQPEKSGLPTEGSTAEVG